MKRFHSTVAQRLFPLILGCTGLILSAVALIASAGPGASAVSAAPVPQVQTMSCSSDDMRRHGCSVDTRDGVFIVRQRSEADCAYGRTWGYDRQGIWVDRGCRADFEVIDRRDREWRDYDDDRRDHDRDDRRDRDDHRDRDEHRDRDDRPPPPR